MSGYRVKGVNKLEIKDVSMLLFIILFWLSVIFLVGLACLTALVVGYQNGILGLLIEISFIIITAGFVINS